MNRPAEPLPEPPKDLSKDLMRSNEVIPAEADYTPETDMITTERTANQITMLLVPAGNTFKDQEVEIVATPSAAKGNTNDDQEVSVDAATVNKILNEQNA